MGAHTLAHTQPHTHNHMIMIIMIIYYYHYYYYYVLVACVTMFSGFPFDIRVFPRLGYHGIIDIPQTLSSKVGVVEHTDEDKISS